MVIVDFVYCRFGVPWLKPTRIVCNIPELRGLMGGCPGGHHHQHLRGVAPSGVLWTKIACAYPAQLCAAYGTLIAQAVRGGSLAQAFSRRAARTDEAQSSSWCRAVSAHWDRKPWRLCWKGVWTRTEHINVLELRTVAGLARHLSRTSRQWDRRVLVLCDSQVTIGCCKRMRAKNFLMLCVLRRIGAISLALGIRLALRWVPSARNAADAPLRGLPVKPPTPDDKKKEEIGISGPPQLCDDYHRDWHL